jgi:hypothetical protein
VTSETNPLVPECHWCEDSTYLSKSNIRKQKKFFFPHQIASELLHNLPDSPILQPVPDLLVVIYRSAANLSGGHLGCGIAHGVVLALSW